MSDVIIQLSGDEKKLLDCYRRAVEGAAKLPVEVDKATKATEKADKELVKYSQHIKDLQTSPVERVRMEMERVNQAQAKGLLTSKEAAIHQASLQSGLTKTSALMTGVTASAQGWLVAFVGVSTILGKVSEGMAEIEAKGKAAMEETRRLVDANSSGVQNATNRGDYNQFKQTADNIAVLTGYDRLLARNLEADMQAGGLGDRDDLSYDYAYADMVRVAPAATLSALAIDMPKMTGGALSAEQGVNFGLIAGRIAKQNAGTIQPELKRMMEQSQRTGALPEEIGAFVALASYNMQNPGQRGASLQSAIASNERTKGMTFFGALDAMSADQGLHEDVLKNNAEASGAYEWAIKNRAALETSKGEFAVGVYQETGSQNDALHRAMRIGATAEVLRRMDTEATKQQAAIDNEKRHGPTEESIAQGWGTLQSALDRSDASLWTRGRAALDFTTNTRFFGNVGSGSGAHFAGMYGGEAGQEVVAERAAAREFMREMVSGMTTTTDALNRAAERFDRASASHAGKARAHHQQAQE